MGDRRGFFRVFARGTAGVLLFALAGCRNRRYQSSAGVYHTVQRGQTLYRIALTYGVSVDAIVRANRLRDPNRIYVGQRLLIPGAARSLAVPSVAPGEPPRGQSVSAPAAPNPTARPARAVTLRLDWPLRGTITSRFGLRDGVPHQGLDITAPEGTPIVAAAPGTVVFDGAMRGYGNVVILDHGEGVTTIYGHNRTNRARVGDRVQRAQEIAEVGQTGRATGPHLHFEVRVDGDPYNPELFLP